MNKLYGFTILPAETSTRLSTIFLDDVTENNQIVQKFGEATITHRTDPANVWNIWSVQLKGTIKQVELSQYIDILRNVGIIKNSKMRKL